MNKLFALMLAALLALTPALAEAIDPLTTPERIDPLVTPEPPAEEAPLIPEVPPTEAPGDESPQNDPPGREQNPGQTIELTVDGERVTLDFDASPLYSSIADGLVQASYYTYSADGSRLYEFYMLFPDSAQRGMVITPDYSALINAESSVVLRVTDVPTEKEVYYFCSQMSGGVYPENSDFAIAIDDVVQSDGATTFSGTLTATLIALDMTNGAVLDTLQIPETPFSFTIGASDERHDAPLPTEKPLDDDMRKT